MKRNRKLLAMLAALLLLLGATALAAKLAEAEQVVDPDADDVVIFSITPEDATSISWSYGGETYTAVLKDGVWCSGADSSFLLDEAYLDEMLAQLESVMAYRTIDDPDDLENYGLREPQSRISVNYLDDLTLFIGNETGIGGQYYCSIDDGKVYLVDAGVMEAFSYTLDQIVVSEEETTAE